LNCSIGIATSRLVAKVTSDQAKPNGILWVLPGQEAAFLAPLEVRKIPGVGRVMEKNLHAIGIHKVGDLAALDELFLKERFGKWGLALAGKARGADAGGWFDGEVGEYENPKSISHEHTFNQDTADAGRLDGMIARLAELVGRRLRDQALFARTIQVKFRYSDFSTFTRAHSLDHATNLDIELLEQARGLFHASWNGSPIRLIGVHAGSLVEEQGQMNLLDGGKSEQWRKALTAVDRIRDRFGESSVSMAAGMGARFHERTHEAMVRGGAPRADPTPIPPGRPRVAGAPAGRRRPAAAEEASGSEELPD
jgi:DNA polymerase-4